MRNLRGQFADRDIEQALIALKKGTNVLKHGRHGRPKTCFCWLSGDGLAVCYHSDKQKSIPLANVTKVVRGQKTAVFRRYLQVDKECQSISLIYNRGERTLDFVCQRTEEADIWYIGLQALLGRPSQDKEDTEETLAKYVPSRSPKDLSPGLPYMSPVRSPYENENVNDLIENVSESSSIPAVPVYIFGNGNSSEMSQVDVRDAAEWESVSTADSLRGSLGGGSQAESSERGGPGSWGGEKPTHSPDTLISGLFTSRHNLNLSSELTAQIQQGTRGEEVEALGDVFMWGEGLGGGAWGMQASVNGTRGDALVPVRLEACAVLDVTAMACGSRHAALVTRQGEVFCWGEEKGGRLGQGVEGDMQRPHLVEALAAKAEAVACGDFHTCVVTREGELYSWGDGAHLTGAVGHGSNVSPWLPKPVTLFDQHVVQVACGPYHTAVVIETGQLFTFGDGTFGALGHGDHRSTKIPVEVQALRGHRTLQVSCGVWHTAAVVDVLGSDASSVHEGRVFTWGDGDKGCLGHGDTTERLVPVLVNMFQDFPCTQVACGCSFTAILTAIGQVFTMGSSSYGQLGRKTTDGRVPGLVEGELQGKPVEQIACGAQHLAALVSGAEVYSWGRGENGRLGHGDVKDRHFPTCVDALRGRRVLQVACGGTFTAAICAHKQTSGLENRACSQCRQTFGLRRSRHGCYHCGRSVCHSCSTHRALGAALAPSSLRPSRVCDRCYGILCQGPVPTLHSIRTSNSSLKGGWTRQRSAETNPSDSADLSRKGGGEPNNGPSGKLFRLQSFANSSPKWGRVSFPRSFSESILLGSINNGMPRPGSDPTVGDMGEKIAMAQFGNPSVNFPRKGKSVTGSPIRRSASPSRRENSPMNQGGNSTAAPLTSSGYTPQDLEVLTLRRSNETMGHEVNRLRVLVDEWREQFESMEREAEIEKSQREAQAAEVEAGNELLAALSAQLASAAQILPPGSVRYGKLAMKGGSGSVIYSGPLLVGETLPPTLIELPEDSITEDEGLPLLIRSNSPVKRSSSSQDFSGSLSRGFSISNLWHSASRTSRDRHPNFSLNETNGRTMSDSGEVGGGGAVGRREAILRGQRRPWPSVDGGSKVIYQHSFNNAKHNSSVESESRGFASQSRNSDGRLHEFPSEKNSRQNSEGFGGTEHSSGPTSTASETGRRGILPAPTFTKWGANLCSDPMGGEDSSESGTPPASESERPILPSGELKPDFFLPNCPPPTANEGEPSTSHPFPPSFGFPLGNSMQSQGGASQSNSMPVDSEEEGAVSGKGPGDGEKKEKVEHPAEGVFITLTAHSTEGYNELRRVQFSGKLFNEKQAEIWWTENKVRIREQYKIRSNRARNTEVLLKKSGELGKHRT